MSKILLLAAFVATGAAGLIAGTALQAVPPPPSSGKTVEIHETVDGAQLASLVRTVVREEMARAPAAPVAAVAVEKERPPTPVEPTAEQLEAHERGQSIVSAAQRVGRWSNQDRDQLRQVFQEVNENERDELLRSLLPAINRQEIKVDVQGPPF